MSDHPTTPSWGPQGQGGYGPPGPQSPGGYPPVPGGYGPPAPQGYGPTPGGYPSAPGYGPSGPGGYGPQGSGGYPPQGGGFGPGGPGRKKSTGLILGIVAAGLVLLVSLGGIVMALTRGGDSDQPSSSITPGAPVPPPDSPSDPPSSDPGPSKQPSASTSPGSTPPQSPGGSPVSLGRGISVTPSAGWKVTKKGDGAAQLSNGDALYAGLVATVDRGSNPVQLCDSYHRSIAEKATNGKFEKAKAVDLGSSRVKGAGCVAQVTVSSGQGSSEVLLYSVVSVRTDGVTAIGTLYFTSSADTGQLGRDFTAMFNSMLKGQLAGG